MLPSSRHLGRVALLLVAVGPVFVAAQEPTRPAFERDWYVRAIVLDSADLRGASGSLVTFLAGRVPGLVINSASGLATAPARAQAVGAAGTLARPDPFLYVDGVLIRDDPHWLAHEAIPQPPSLGWGLPIEEVEEIRVFVGASGGTALEFGGARGVVQVFTRRPRGDAIRISASLETAQITVEPSIEINEGTFGTTTGAPTNVCTLYLAANGSCTPTGRTRWSPYALTPYRSAQRLRAAVSAAGATPWVRYRASAIEDATGGILPSRSVRRTDVALALTREQSVRLTLDGDLRFARITHPRNRWDGLSPAEYGKLVGPEETTLQRDEYLAYIDRLEASGDVSTERWTAGGGATFLLTPAAQLRVHLSASGAGREFFNTTGLPTTVLTDTEKLNYFSQRASIEATGRLSVRSGLALANRASLFWTRTTFDEIARTSTNPDQGSSFTRLEADLEVRGASMATRLLVGTRGAVGVGVRTEQFRRGPIIPTLGSADASWELRGSRNGARWGAMRLSAVAAYDESVDHRTGFAALGNFEVAPVERSRTREAGLSSAWGPQLGLGVTRRRTDVSDGSLRSSLLAPPDPGLVTNLSWRSDATLWRLAARSPPGAATTWRADLLVADVAPARFTYFPVLPFFAQSATQGGLLIFYEKGGALDQIYMPSFTYVDTNLDGIIAPSEVTMGDYVVSNAEPRWIISLRSSITLRAGLEIGVFVESRRGQEALDLLEGMRCRISQCRALHEPGTSLEDQAAAVGSDALGIMEGFVHDASFTRLREVYVEFTLPARLSTATLGRARIRLTGHNLALWTRFPRVDPETIDRFGGMSNGIAGHNQPLPRTISLRVDLGH